MNIQRKELMVEKTGVIGALDLPEKAEHTKERKSKIGFAFYPLLE